MSHPETSDRDRLLDHEYDGIQEFDNPMPRWWVNTFWVTIVFSILYAINIGPVGSGPGRIAQYEAEVAAYAAKQPPAGPAMDAAQLAALVQDPAAVQLGRETYDAMCASCHRQDGGGMIGPNLTDDYWLHGGSLPDILHTVAVGVTEKGMPGWEKLLKPDQLTAVVAYVATLHGTNPPEPKAPQGDLVTAGAQ